MRGPDATFERGEQVDVATRDVLPRWRTTDAAVLEAVPFELGAPALRYEPRVSGSPAEAQRRRDDLSAVLAALGGLPELERRLVEWYAWMRHERTGGYRALAQRASAARDPVTGELMGWPGRVGRVRVLHQAARARLHARLVVLGLVEE